MGTPHNEAAQGAFAKTVLMPGDPLRAKFIAEHFLDGEKMTWYTARSTFISSELDAGTPITHVAEMAGNSARTIGKHYYKNTKQPAVFPEPFPSL